VKESVRQNRKELIVIFLIPLPLFLLFLLPNDLKEMLVLHRDYSNIYDIYTANFVHEEFNNLTSNVVAYIMFTLVLYVLLLLLNKKELFYKLLLLNLSIVPIIVSLAWIPVNRYYLTLFQRTLGFSGIVSSILGMAIYAYILFVHEKIKINIQYTYYSAISLILLLPVLVYFKFTVYFIIIMIFLVIAFLVTTYKTANTIDEKAEAKMKSLLPCLYVIILFVSWAVFFGDPKYTNIFIHYFGFVIGSLLIPLMFHHS
jgi:hypothetical protein